MTIPQSYNALLSSIPYNKSMVQCFSSNEENIVALFKTTTSSTGCHSDGYLIATVVMTIYILSQKISVRFS